MVPVSFQGQLKKMLKRGLVREFVGVILLVLWRAFPWPYGRGRYFFKRVVLTRILPLHCLMPFWTDVGWLYLEIGSDVLQTQIAFSGTHYEHKVVDVIRNRICFGEDDVALDIGAHAGYYSLLLGRRLGSKGRVIAFEPQPHLAMACRRSMAINGISWVQVEEHAVSDRAGTLRIYQTEDTGRSSLVSQTIGTHSVLNISSISLDHYVFHVLGRMPALIKMDIEGAEWFALQGMKETLALSHPKLIIEVHPLLIEALGGNQKLLLQGLVELEYELFLIDHREGLLPFTEPPQGATTWHLFATSSGKNI